MKKICNKCKIEKLYEDFVKNKGCRDGYTNICKICTSENIKEYREANKERVKEQKREANKKYNDTHREEKNAHNREYMSKIKDTKEYKKKHSKCNTSYDKRREAIDPSYKIKLNLRTRISSLLKKGKVGSSIKDLGCTLDELKTHLESKFTNNMSWDNYGRKGWHIDHIIPLSSFDLSKEEDFKKACHYTNLQPLWWTDNLKKSNKIN